MKKRVLSISEKKGQARSYSIKAGILGSAKTSIGDKFIAPFAIALNASSPIVALLTSISSLLNPATQLFSSKLLEKKSRKKITLLSNFLRSFFWIFLVLIAFLFYKGILTGILPIFLLAFFAFYVVSAGIATPAWFSWLGDIVDEKDRGRFFSKRRLILGISSLFIAIVASLFLDFFKENSWVMFGFMILFLLAFISRRISSYVIKKQYEPKLKIRKGYYFSFWEFMKRAPTNNFGKFAIYRFFLTLTTTVSGSLLAVYLLRYLEFNYSTYMIVSLAGTGIALLFIELWGKIADTYGSYSVIKISSILLALVPLLWVLNSDPLYLILIPSVASGIAWAGFHLAESNFIYDNVQSQKRGLAISYYNMFWGAGGFLGALIAAMLIKFIAIKIIEPIIAIFALGSLLRLIVVLIGIKKVKEIKRKTNFRGLNSLETMLAKETRPTIHNEINEIVHIGKYLKIR